MTNTNAWLTKTPPFQYNYDHRGQTLHWNGTDQPDTYKKNLKDPSNRSLLDKLGWIDSVIEYSYNSHGFRCEEFDQRPCAIALGCSFTEGMGLHAHQTWPAYLSELLNLHVWNLGSGGGSIDTVFRMLDYYIDKLNPRYVCILTPPNARFEYRDIYGGFPIIQYGSFGSHPTFAKEWLSQSYNAIYNARKTILAIKQLCNDSNVPVFTHSSEDATGGNIQGNQVDLARDLMHRGFLYQKEVAEIMYQKINFIKQL